MDHRITLVLDLNGLLVDRVVRKRMSQFCWDALTVSNNKHLGTLPKRRKRRERDENMSIKKKKTKKNRQNVAQGIGRNPTQVKENSSIIKQQTRKKNQNSYKKKDMHKSEQVKVQAEVSNIMERLTNSLIGRPEKQNDLPGIEIRAKPGGCTSIISEIYSKQENIYKLMSTLSEALFDLESAKIPIYCTDINISSAKRPKVRWNYRKNTKYLSEYFSQIFEQGYQDKRRIIRPKNEFSYIRPHIKTFFTFLTSRFNIIFWTSADKTKANLIFAELFKIIDIPELISQPRYFRDTCTIKERTILKDLSRLKLTAENENIILIDDSLSKDSLNTSYCLINPDSWEFDQIEDDLLSCKGKLYRYLEILHTAVKTNKSSSAKKFIEANPYEHFI